MFENYELAVIGAGTMAEAIVRGGLKSGYLWRGSVVACDLNPERRELFESEFGVATTDDIQVCAPCPYILLATKPYNVDEVLSAIAPTVHEGVTVISICAGVTTKQISDALGGKARVVRVMPNTPMRVNAGASAVAPGPRCKDENLHWARRLFAASGLSVVMPEEQMDAVTGLSGSGPAYVFYLIEAMIEAGIAEGIDAETSRDLVLQTCEGAVKLVRESGLCPAELRRRVTTPNGTTQRAIETFQEHGFREAILEAIHNATLRSRELGEE